MKGALTQLVNDGLRHLLSTSLQKNRTVICRNIKFMIFFRVWVNWCVSNRVREHHRPISKFVFGSPIKFREIATNESPVLFFRSHPFAFSVDGNCQCLVLSGNTETESQAWMKHLRDLLWTSEAFNQQQYWSLNRQGNHFLHISEYNGRHFPSKTQKYIITICNDDEGIFACSVSKWSDN